jgi:hypothetical protein
MIVSGTGKMSGESIFKTSWNEASDVEATYSRLCVPALLAALFGVGAFLVYFSFWFFFLGVIAILLGCVALWIIRNGEGTLPGTTLAYFGVCSGIIALVSVTVFWSVYQYDVRREADQFFRLWFASVQQGNIPQAKESRAIYTDRSEAASTDEWWEKQYENKYSHRAVHQYVEDKLVRVLMALGNKAKVSYYKTLSIDSERESNTVTSVYAVTFPAEFGITETFFVKISGKRVYPSNLSAFKAAGWQISGTPAFYLPDEFK